MNSLKKTKKIGMSLKLIIPTFLALTLIIMYMIKSSKTDVSYPVIPPYPGNITDSFLVGAVQNGKAPNYLNIVGVLGLNLWHQYTETEPINPMLDVSYPRFAPVASGWSSREHIYTTPSGPAYIDDVRNKLIEIQNNNMWSLMQRPKIEWLCYGQRSDYQCEELIHVPFDNWFYSFQSPNYKGQDVQDFLKNNGNWVRICSPAAGDLSGSVVSRLRANTEQCHRNTDVSVGNQWHGDSYCDWYIKPRVRVDPGFVMTPGNQNISIFRIKVFAQDGVTIKLDVDVKAKNFLDPRGNYNGDYIEEFFDPTGRSGKLSLLISGDWGNEWTYNARGNASGNAGHNNADIQIDWSGNCDTWFDYVRVDNDVAYNLLDTISGRNATHDIYESWLQSEARDIACFNNSPLKFYVELTEYNNIPCIAYVNNKLLYYSNCGKNVNVMTNLTNFYSLHVPWFDPIGGLDKRTLENAGHIKRNYIDRINATQIFMESYPFWACYDDDQKFSKIPSSLLTSTGPGVLASSTSSDSYDDWLQDNLDHQPYQLVAGQLPTDLIWCNGGLINQDWGNFRYRMQLGDEISKMKNIPFIYMVQSHQWFRSQEVRREPTIEEMDLLSNISVSYGARGNIFFEYSSSNPVSAGSYNRGLFDVPSGSTEIPRYRNFYNQLKWDKAQEIIKRLKTKWGPYLMSFDNCHRHSYIYRLESNALATQSYFKNIDVYQVSTYPNHATTPEIVCKRTGYIENYFSQYKLTGISTPDSLTGFICGLNGTILKSINEGSTWINLTSDTSLSLQDISFINVNTGFAAGDFGKVILTTDGGLNWVNRNVPINTSIKHTQLITPSKGICVGLNGRIFQTTNLGLTWITDTNTTNYGLWGVHFISPDSGYICGDSGTILFTQNGGVTWNNQNSTVSSSLRAIYFINKDTGYSVGTFGVLLKTTNGGNSWQLKNSGTTENLNAIYFIDNFTGTVVGNEFISSTSDGGNSWTPRLPSDICGKKRALEDVEYFSKLKVDVVGDDGLIFNSNTGGISYTDSCSYLQVATFYNPNEPKVKYFMMVNRRCSPFDFAHPNNPSGIRYITIEFDSNHPDLRSAPLWQIYEIIDPTTDIPIGIPFNPASPNLAFDLEWFKPGEGKLYKIVPQLDE